MYTYIYVCIYIFTHYVMLAPHSYHIPLLCYILVNICMYVHMYTYIYIYVHTCICITNLWKYIHIYICIFIYEFMHVHIYIHSFMYTYICIYISVYMYIFHDGYIGPNTSVFLSRIHWPRIKCIKNRMQKIQGGEDAQALSCSSFSAQEPLLIWLFGRK